MSFSSKLADFLKRLEVLFAFFLISILVVVVFFRLLLRNFMNYSWAVEVAEIITLIVPHITLLLGFIGASIGFSRGEVIQIDIFKKLYNKKIGIWMNLFFYVLTLFLTGLFIWIAIGAMQFGDEKWIMIFYIPGFLLLFGKIIILIWKSYEEHV